MLHERSDRLAGHEPILQQPLGTPVRTLVRMKTCSACGTENPDIARFCLACGSQLAEAAPPQETRKVVTIVFSDLKGSTSLGEALDSEALREVMTRYFDAMRAELERHGGVVEKFIGDAVMAVFGLPRLHEDDALRAVRAAAGMQAALERINGDLQRHYGVQLVNRTGVNTGEVVAGDPATGQRLVTGDAVNVAARLEQAAGEREVLLGELTYRLVRDSVEVEEVEPLELKGKAERVPAFRLARVLDAAGTARGAAPLVGRDRELEQLGRALAAAVETRTPRLVTIVADAGVGKSRLTAEFVAQAVGRVLPLNGRCLPYGEGITFWPVAEAVKALAGIVNEDDASGALAKLTRLADSAGDGVTIRLASVLGLAVDPFPVEELFWAIRRLLSWLASERPVVFVVEDIHWAEPTMLALLEHLLHALDDAPVLIVCPTRPDLLHGSPDWGSGERATRIVLEPLGAEDSRSMVESLLDGASLEALVLERVVRASEGNPLFAEQLLRMLVDEGAIERHNGAWRAARDLSDIDVPPTIQALLASRLDTLASGERAVIEPASVVGYVFPDAAVAALAPPDLTPRVGSELSSLAQKHLVRRVEESDDRAHRFHHIMIRDTAYDGILKRARADLHTRFVTWADTTNQDRGVEFEEILGYHLEQAWTYLSELGPLDEKGRAIGEDGSRRLAAAGRRAFARGDIPGAASLLGRAAALLPEDAPERARLLPDHGEALLMTGRYAEAAAVLEDAIDRSSEAPAAAARASLVRLLVRLRTGEADDWQPEWVDEEIHRAMRVFESEGDEGGLAMACRLLAWSAGIACRYGDAVEANERAIEHARRAGDVRQERRATTAYAGATSLGPTNVDDAIRRCEACLAATEGDRQSEGNLLAVLGGLYAMQGEFDQAREHLRRARSLLEELGVGTEAAWVGIEAWRTELLAGDVDAAERELRRSYETLDAYGERYTLSTVAALLAQTLLAQAAPLEEAERMVERSRELASAGDVATQALWRCARGRILARRGALAEAEALVREGVELLESTDFTILRVDAYLDLGEVLVARGRMDEARRAYERARDLAESKGSVVLLANVILRIEALDAALT
jgi:class 3 adenylate cyclase/tetratricopeptide (TPR) repeat protein